MIMAVGSSEAAQPAASPTFNIGPEVGARIPLFEAHDQNGTLQTFQSLKGPNGVVLVLYRSADW